MTLSKNFLSKELKHLEIDRFRLIVGLLLGLLSSFALYALLYMVRESFRLISLTEKYDLWILSDKEVYFYNLIFAFISTIIAQSVCFTFWFDRPKSIFRKPKYRKSSVINDQRVLNWYFLSWFSELAIVFGILFGVTFYNGFYTFSLYPKYNYIFILILIVLFLQTWNTIRLKFKRKSLKWMLLSMLTVSAIAFGLSRINLIDYKTINQIHLQKNIQFTYKLELPETDHYQRPQKRSLILDIYVVLAEKHTANSEPIIIVDNQIIAFEEIEEKIIQLRSDYKRSDFPYLTFLLHIDKNIKMDFINKFKIELSRSGFLRIAYAVTPINPEYDRRYYQNLSFPWILSPEIPGLTHNAPSKENVIEIRQSGSGSCYINDVLTDLEHIEMTLKTSIQQNLDYSINYYQNDNIALGEYLKVLSFFKAAIYSLRNEYSEDIYSKPFIDLEDEAANTVREKYPLLFIELSPQMTEASGDE